MDWLNDFPSLPLCILAVDYPLFERHRVIDVVIGDPGPIANCDVPTHDSRCDNSLIVFF